jgi:hypothetical protein
MEEITSKVECYIKDEESNDEKKTREAKERHIGTNRDRATTCPRTEIRELLKDRTRGSTVYTTSPH